MWDSSYSARCCVDFDGAIDCIRKGGVLFFPTETFFAIGAAITSFAALEAIAYAKARPHSKPFPLVVANRCQLGQLCDCSHLSPVFFALWPAPLTCVLPMHHNTLYSSFVQNASGEVAIRIPSHPTLRSLCLKCGPITASSANCSGKAPAKDVCDIDERLCTALTKRGILWRIYEDRFNPPKGGLPSTIVKPKGKSLTILREGAYGLSNLRAQGFELVNSKM